MSKTKRQTKRQTKPNPTTIRLYPECEERLLKIARAHNCINTSGRYKGQESWRVFLDQLRMRDDGTLYVEQQSLTPRHAA